MNERSMPGRRPGRRLSLLALALVVVCVVVGLIVGDHLARHASGVEGTAATPDELRRDREDHVRQELKLIGASKALSMPRHGFAVSRHDFVCQRTGPPAGQTTRRAAQR